MMRGCWGHDEGLYKNLYRRLNTYQLALEGQASRLASIEHGYTEQWYSHLLAYRVGIS